MDENLFRQIKSKLNAQHFLANDDWFWECIEYYKKEFANSTEKEILEFVKSQWLLSDLRHINNQNGSLPRNISLQASTTLTGNFILQVDQMYDIATSKYKQLDQIRNKKFSVIEDEEEKVEPTQVPTKRMIQLKLTDGLQDLIGIEYKCIPQLNDTFLPGYKVMIIGPVKCRKSVLLLEEGRIKGIGGEVDSLLIPNALENILARALNVEQNSDPYHNDDLQSKKKEKVEEILEDNFFDNDFEIDLEEVSRLEGWSCGNRETGNSNATVQEKNKSRSLNVQPVIESRKNDSTVKSVNQTSRKGRSILESDNSFLDMVDESQFVDEVSNYSTKQGLRAFPVENDLSDIITIVSDEEEEKTNLKAQKSERNIPNLFSASTSRERIVSKNVKATVSDSGGKRLTASILSPETTVPKRGRIDSAEPIKIKELSKFTHENRSEINHKKVRAKIEVLGKLTKDKTKWILEATICDDSGKLEISFSNEFLEKFLNLTVEEFSRKKKLKKSNPEIEHELRMNFRKAEQKLKNLDALFELRISKNQKPEVIKMNNCTEQQY